MLEEDDENQGRRDDRFDNVQEDELSIRSNERREHGPD